MGEAPCGWRAPLFAWRGSIVVAEPRAVVFDLDGTLYPFRQFAASGFRVVARVLERDHGLPEVDVFRTLCRARTGGARGREVQAVCAAFGLSAAVVGPLVARILLHEPTLRLPRESAAVLRHLRARYRLGILTNGDPAVQRRKVAALGLSSLVDAVVYACELGRGEGKPAPDGFLDVMDRLRSTPETTVFVGDDARADIAGAGRLGLRTVFVERWAGEPPLGGVPTASVATVSDVPRVVHQWVCEEARQDVA
jgi:putative hydrolase of the HAD superfamily